MAEKYLLFSLEDEKAKKLGDVIANATCKKIVNFLAEKESSETEIATSLHLPLNTVEYNIKKLLEAGIIEKSRTYFWSVKGKKIGIYKVANKLIVIAPKKSSAYSKLKSIIPVVLISGILTAFIAWYVKLKSLTIQGAEKLAEAGEKALTATTQEAVGKGVATLYSNPWIWFAIGALIAIIIFIIWNWRKL